MAQGSFLSLRVLSLVWTAAICGSDIGGRPPLCITSTLGFPYARLSACLPILNYIVGFALHVERSRRSAGSYSVSL
ncbi:hypothetical protein CLAFUR0_20058 [Fulvia fulva]|nr:hypothetical protein CLAFUR0_20058 [Fulvia fulva]